MPGGVITSADLYRKMEDLRVNVTLALDKLGRADQIHADHEMRIRALERFRYSLLGAGMLAGAAAGTAAGILSSFLAGHP
jgi:hypothetical protein